MGLVGLGLLRTLNPGQGGASTVVHCTLYGGFFAEPGTQNGLGPRAAEHESHWIVSAIGDFSYAYFVSQMKRARIASAK